MEKHEEDKYQNSGTIFFIIIFLIFVLAFSGKSESQASSSSGYYLQNELSHVSISVHFNATLFNSVSLSDLYKNCIHDLCNTSFNLVSLQSKIFNYDHRTVQNFIDIQKTRLTIKPLFLWRLYYPLPSNEKEDLPVLS
jgi:hypothetical protein